MKSLLRKLLCVILSLIIASAAVTCVSAQVSVPVDGTLLYSQSELNQDTPEAPEGDESEAPEGDESEAPEGDESEAPEGDESEAPEDDESEAPEGDESEAPEGDEPEKKGSDTVGKISLCSRWSSITTTGHIWVYIENTSEEALRVGLYDLPAGEGLSLATFGFTRSDGFGLYYNMETYRNDKYCDDSCICITDDLTREELEKVTERLLLFNYWDPFINCVFFACTIWNIAGNKTVVPFFYPPVARLQIAVSGDAQGCVMNYQPPENSFKQRGLGSSAYLENVSQKSLDAK